MKKYTFLLITIIMLAGCKGNSNNKYSPGSTGSPYEAVVVCDDNLWKGVVGDTLRAIMLENEEFLNLPEPKFSLLRRTTSSFKNTFMRHRNVLIFKEDKAATEATLVVSKDLWATPQIVITLIAPTQEEFFKLLSTRYPEILSLFNEEEQSRFETKLRTFASKDLQDTMLNIVGFSMNLPKNYKVRNAIYPYFIWLSYEMPISSQGIVAYTYPYKGEELTQDFLIKMRNEYTKLIPGQLENSHMQTSDAFEPELTEVEIKGMLWKKMRGFWNVSNDFMGGPFVNFTTIDQNNNRVISIDCYVYSPDGNKGQRNYMKQLEASVRTITFN